jgi:hypothetical protein
MNAIKGIISGMFDVSTYIIDFFKLSNTFRPSSTPYTIEAKSSSSKIISAASLVTSDPEIFIEIPISPYLIAGESLTPSPVTAQMNPSA